MIKVFSLSLCFFLFACAQAQQINKPKQIKASFSSNVNAGGLKVFKLSAKESLIHSPTDLKILERWMNQELAIQLETSGFCQQGYTEIERSIGNGFAFIRGECNELK